MAKLSAEQFADKHASRLQAASADIERGVNAVTEAPGIKAAAAKDKMKANLIAAIDNGKWEQNVKAVSVEEWRRKMINKGIPAISTGIIEARDKVVAFANQLLPAVDAAQAKVKAMPSTTLQQNIARATTMMLEMAKFKFKR